MAGRRIGVRAYLTGKLKELGYFRRDSVWILNTVSEAMKQRLKRGRDVEFPFGRLRVVEKHLSKYWETIGDVPAGRERYTVELVLNEAGERLLNGEGSS